MGTGDAQRTSCCKSDMDADMAFMHTLTLSDTWSCQACCPSPSRCTISAITRRPRQVYTMGHNTLYLGICKAIACHSHEETLQAHNGTKQPSHLDCMTGEAMADRPWKKRVGKEIAYVTARFALLARSAVSRTVRRREAKGY